MIEVEIWHPDSDGKMNHYVQITQNGIRQYFTGGKLVMTLQINPDGTVKA